MQNKNHIYIAGGALALVLAISLHLYTTGYFDNGGATEEEPGTTEEGEIDLGGLGLNVGDTKEVDGYTIERLPNDSGTQGVAFNFDRPIPEAGGLVEGSARVQAVSNLENLISSLKASPEKFNSWLSLGVYRLILGDSEGAILAWEETAKLFPTAWEPHVNLGNYYRDNGDSANARREYQLALDKAGKAGNTEIQESIQLELGRVK